MVNRYKGRILFKSNYTILSGGATAQASVRNSSLTKEDLVSPATGHRVTAGTTRSQVTHSAVRLEVSKPKAVAVLAATLLSILSPS